MTWKTDGSTGQSVGDRPVVGILPGLPGDGQSRGEWPSAAGADFVAKDSMHHAVSIVIGESLVQPDGKGRPGGAGIVGWSRHEEVGMSAKSLHVGVGDFRPSIQDGVDSTECFGGHGRPEWVECAINSRLRERPATRNRRIIGGVGSDATFIKDFPACSGEGVVMGDDRGSACGEDRTFNPETDDRHDSESCSAIGADSGAKALHGIFDDGELVLATHRSKLGKAGRVSAWGGEGNGPGSFVDGRFNRIRKQRAMSSINVDE